MGEDLQKTVDWLTFTKSILKRKASFLWCGCSDDIIATFKQIQLVNLHVVI